LLAALARLARLLAHALALIAYALATVRLRRPEVADLGRGLADELLVGAVQDQDRALRVGRDGRRDALGQRVDDRVRVAEREVEHLALLLDAVAGALQLEGLLVALGDALHRGGDDGAHEPLQARGIAAGRGRADVQLAPVGLDRDRGGDRLDERAL